MTHKWCQNQVLHPNNDNNKKGNVKRVKQKVLDDEAIVTSSSNKRSLLRKKIAKCIKLVKMEKNSWKFNKEYLKVAKGCPRPFCKDARFSSHESLTCAILKDPCFHCLLCV